MNATNIRPPLGLAWTEWVENGAWKFRAGPVFSGRQAGRLYSGFVLAAVGTIFGQGDVAFVTILLGLGVALLGLLRRRPPNTIVLSDEGLSLDGYPVVGSAAIERFECIISERGAGWPADAVIRVHVHGQYPTTLTFDDALDSVVLRFIARRLNAALGARVTRGYR